MLGVKETKEAVVALCKLANALDSSTKDGIGVDDIGKFVEPLMALPAAAEGADKIVEEVKDLDEAELADLHATVKAELDLEDDQVEGFVEDALLAAVSLFSLVKRFQALKEAAE